MGPLPEPLIESAVTFHLMEMQGLHDLFEHELRRSTPNKHMLIHYSEAMQLHMRMASNAVLSREV